MFIFTKKNHRLLRWLSSVVKKVVVCSNVWNIRDWWVVANKTEFTMTCLFYILAKELVIMKELMFGLVKLGENLAVWLWERCSFFICHHIFVWKIMNRKRDWHDLTGLKGAGSCCAPERRREPCGKTHSIPVGKKRATCVSTKEPWTSSSPLAEHACASVAGRWRNSCKCSEMGLRKMLIHTEIKLAPTLCTYRSTVGFIC